MKGDPLPPEHHFARHCKRSKVFQDGSVHRDVFLLRRKSDGSPDEDNVSGGWLEKYSNGDREAQIRQLRFTFARHRAFRQRDRFALLNVGVTVAFVQEQMEDARRLRFLHDPFEGHHEHAGIYDTLVNEDRVIELLARCVGTNTVLAVPPS